MGHKFPKLIRVKNDPDFEGLEKALVGCELHPDHGICLGWENPIWLSFGVKVSDLKKRYPEIFQRFREEIRIFCGEMLTFGGSDCDILY
jgi:hypothetical protein